MTRGTALARVTVPILLMLALPQCGKSSDQPRNASKAQAQTTQPSVTAAPATAPDAKGSQVTIRDFAYDPKDLTVPVGTKVTWVNKDDEAHTVTSNTKLFQSEPLDSNEQFSHVFATPGTYPYYCKLHSQMTGRIIVK